MQPWQKFTVGTALTLTICVLTFVVVRTSEDEPTTQDFGFVDRASEEPRDEVGATEVLQPSVDAATPRESGGSRPDATIEHQEVVAPDSVEQPVRRPKPEALARLAAPPPEELEGSTLQLWTNARDAMLGASELKEVNKVGKPGRAFWNLVNLDWHSLPDSFDQKIIDVWTELLTRICDDPVEIDSALLVATIRSWSLEAEQSALRTYQSFGIDGEALHGHSPAERSAAKEEILDLYGTLLPDFAADVAECISSPEGQVSWTSFVDWISS